MGELTEKIKGNTNEAIGEVKQQSGNPQTRREGREQEVKGKAQQLKGEVEGALGNDI
ncbi:CsbD family protein [Croceicoccus sp. Ery15]|uniref:CsbD family protein n=1 Tax=Croceicoccus sp. Ery15 TaxID=1703338 RepID=UPI001E638639|nr:CsbD family protein [Croceicoccus sp. Ery15]